MAKFLEILPENQQVFTEVINGTTLSNVNIKILASNTQKEISKVIKANDLLKHMTEEDVIIIINEKIFDLLEEQQKLIVADEAIAGIHMNEDTEKVTINKPDFLTYSGILTKYTAPVCVNLKEQIKLMYAQDKEKNAENNVSDSEVF